MNSRVDSAMPGVGRPRDEGFRIVPGRNRAPFCRGRPTPDMAESTREFTEKEYLLVVLVGVALLMAGTGLILVLTSV